MKFSIVDAFSKGLFGGNQAGVVIIPKGKDFPSNDIMIKTAAELRYSETAFVKPLGVNEFHTRYFTPVAEIDLCGHATIATFQVLLEEGMISAGKKYINKTLAGNLEIEVVEDSILMEMGTPKNHEIIIAEEKVREIYKVMGIEAQLGKFVPKIVSTGLTDLILPVKDEEALGRILPDFKALSKISKEYGVVGVHAFTETSKDGKIHTRNFAPLYEIDEEAATGTANGALTYYLYEYGRIKLNEINTIVQGEKMGRPSTILTQMILADGRETVKVGGTGAILARGKINI